LAKNPAHKADVDAFRAGYISVTPMDADMSANLDPAALLGSLRLALILRGVTPSSRPGNPRAVARRSRATATAAFARWPRRAAPC
jgi:hypothetical protein